MGDNLRAIHFSPTVKTIVTGKAFTCALLYDGSVRCWGSGGNGQLGYGDTQNRGDGGGEMGKHLPSVDLGTGRSAKFIAAGGYHTCAILDGDSVKCWGYGANGQLGYGDTLSRGDDGGEMVRGVIVTTQFGLVVRAVVVGGDSRSAVVIGGDSGSFAAPLSSGIVTTRGRSPTLSMAVINRAEATS